MSACKKSVVARDCFEEQGSELYASPTPHPSLNLVEAPVDSPRGTEIKDLWHYAGLMEERLYLSTQHLYQNDDTLSHWLRTARTSNGPPSHGSGPGPSPIARWHYLRPSGSPLNREAPPARETPTLCRQLLSLLSKVNSRDSEQGVLSSDVFDLWSLCCGSLPCPVVVSRILSSRI